MRWGIVWARYDRSLDNGPMFQGDSSFISEWGARGGATQMAGVLGSLSVVVSGGGSATTGLGDRPRRPAVPASVSPPRNLRRLNGRACCVLMGIPLPEAGQYDTENAGQ
jgi:hypothetical protein